jgi:hypothetical protein
MHCSARKRGLTKASPNTKSTASASTRSPLGYRASRQLLKLLSAATTVVCALSGVSQSSART